MIFITCPCGKKLQVKQEHAGKQVACPSCKKRLVVPSPPAGPVKAIPVNPNAGIRPVPPSPAGIRPTSSSTAPLPSASVTAAPKPTPANNGSPLASVHRVINNATGGKVSPNLVLLIGGGVVGVFVLLMCAGVSWLAVSWVFPGNSGTRITQNDDSPPPNKNGNGGGNTKPIVKPKPKTDAELRVLDLIPMNTTTFASVRPGDALQNPMVPTIDKKNMLAFAKKEFQTKFGLELTDLEQVVFVTPDAMALDKTPGPKGDADVEFYFLAQTSKPFDKNVLLKGARIDTPPKTYKKKQYYLIDPSGKPEFHIHFFNNHVLLITTEPNIQRFVDGPSRMTAAHELYTACQASQGRHATIASLTTESMRHKAREELKQAGPMADKIKPFIEVHCMQLFAHLQQNHVDIDGTFKFSESATANKAHKSAQALLITAQTLLPGFKDQMGEKIFLALSNILSTTKITEEPNQLALSVRIAQKDLERLADVLNQTGQAGGGPGPGPKPGAGPLVRYKGNGVSFLHPQNWPLEVKNYKFLNDVRISFTSRKGAVGQVWLYGGAASTPQEILKRETRSLRDIYGDKIKAAKSVRRALFGQSCSGLAVDVELSAFTGLHVEVYAFQLPALRKVVNVRIEYDPEMEPGARKQLNAFLDSLRVSR